MIGEGPHREAWRRLRASKAQAGGPRRSMWTRWWLGRIIREEFRRFHLDLAVYPYAQSMAFEADIPYVMAIHDLQHRLQPEFPEVSADGEWEWREVLRVVTARVPRRCFLPIPRSVREDILNFYGPIRRHRRPGQGSAISASVLPRGRSSEEERQRVRAEYRLPSATCSILLSSGLTRTTSESSQALGLLKQDRGMDIPIVFCGSHAGRDS